MKILLQETCDDGDTYVIGYVECPDDTNIDLQPLFDEYREGNDEWQSSDFAPWLVAKMGAGWAAIDLDFIVATLES